ncbi:MAG: hypothetical protein ACR5LA_02380 [Wolbachia sp.]
MNKNGQRVTLESRNSVKHWDDISWHCCHKGTSACYFDDRATLMNKNGQRVTLESRKNQCQLLG